MKCLNYQLVGVFKTVTLRSLPALLFGLLLLNSCNDKPKTKEGDGEIADTIKVDTVSPGKSMPDTSIVTVAIIRRSADGKTVELLFNEKQQIFTFSNDKTSAALTPGLEQSLKSSQPIKIITDPHNATIISTAIPTAEELRIFRYLNKQLIKAAAPRAIEVLKIDTAIFNNADKLNFPVFKFCTKVIPDYATAKTIFDYCAKQSCHLPGPYNISHCIPFQYVIDGCYARAHKMRDIIEKTYGYCSEKVFSFANQGSDRLAVRASKWGGCCVTWWYHVAPVVRVKTRILYNKTRYLTITLVYVIDPGMFDKPVLLSTWLQAQKNQSCSANANVSAYTIQPSSAYSPANYSGTSFTTDPSYTATNATLTNYRNRITCP